MHGNGHSFPSVRPFNEEVCVHLVRSWAVCDLLLLWLLSVQQSFQIAGDMAVSRMENGLKEHHLFDSEF